MPNWLMLILRWGGLALTCQIGAIMAARGSGRVDQAGGTETRGDALPMLDELTSEDQTASGQVVRQRHHPVFAITATAETPGGGVFERAAIVRLTSDPVRPFVFHEWRQVWAPSDPANKDGDDVSDDEADEAGGL